MARRATIYLGLDPGLAKTGYVICSHAKNGTVQFEACGVIKTTAKQPLRERYDQIKSEIEILCGEHHVDLVICEAYEVRPYQGARRASVSMSKLINEVSEAVFNCRLPFLLSSPDIRKEVKADDIPDSVKETVLNLPKYQREHILDAYVHVMYQVKRRARNGR